LNLQIEVATKTYHLQHTEYAKKCKFEDQGASWSEEERQCYLLEKECDLSDEKEYYKQMSRLVSKS
jgi:hypothetical protein